MNIIKTDIMKKLIFITLSILISCQLLHAQVVGQLVINNTNSIGSDYFFDLFIHADATSSGNIYLADAQFRISFNETLFSSPTIEQVSNPASLLGIEDGFCTFEPINNTTTNIVLTRDNYYSGTSLRFLSPGIISIQLSGPTPNSSTFDTRVASINTTQLTHRLGRYKITGYQGSGNPLFSFIYSGTTSTDVFSFASNPPFNSSAVSLITAPFPVEWLYFEAKANDRQEVQLTWTTAAEINNDLFIIEKKLKDGDFEAIAEVKGRGTTNYPTSYKFLDAGLMTNQVYYRIKQVDMDGAFSHSDIVEVNFNWYGQESYVIFPNPVKDQLTIETLQDIYLGHKFQITDLRGKLLLKGEIEAGKGYAKVDLSKISEGVYLVRINNPKGGGKMIKFRKE